MRRLKQQKLGIKGLLCVALVANVAEEDGAVFANDGTFVNAGR